MRDARPPARPPARSLALRPARQGPILQIHSTSGRTAAAAATKPRRPVVRRPAQSLDTCAHSNCLWPARRGQSCLCLGRSWPKVVAFYFAHLINELLQSGRRRVGQTRAHSAQSLLDCVATKQRQQKQNNNNIAQHRLCRSKHKQRLGGSCLRSQNCSKKRGEARERERERESERQVFASRVLVGGRAQRLRLRRRLLGARARVQMSNLGKHKARRDCYCTTTTTTRERSRTTNLHTNSLVSACQREREREREREASGKRTERPGTQTGATAGALYLRLYAHGRAWRDRLGRRFSCLATTGRQRPAAWSFWARASPIIGRHRRGRRQRDLMRLCVGASSALSCCCCCCLCCKS